MLRNVEHKVIGIIDRTRRTEEKRRKAEKLEDFINKRVKAFVDRIISIYDKPGIILNVRHPQTKSEIELIICRLLKDNVTAGDRLFYIERLIHVIDKDKQDRGYKFTC